MKISFVIQDLFSQGAQYVTALMVRGFARRGYEVDLVLSKVHADWAREGKKPFDVPPNTNVIILKDRKARNNIGEIRRYLSRTDAVAIVAMSSNYAEALAIASIGLARRPKMYTVEHGPAGVDRETDLLLPPPRLSWRLLLDKFILSRFDGVLGVSRGTTEGVRRMFGVRPGKTATVYNPVVDETYREKLKRAPSQPWLLDKKMPTFVAVGAFTKTKNHLMLFEAIKIANQTTPVRLVLLGRDNASENLGVRYREFIEQNDLADRITLGGFCENVPAELKLADGFICSSRHESFSVAIVEALAAGCPVISTDCHYGPRELLCDGKYGILVRNNEALDMAKAIVTVARGGGVKPPEESWRPYTLEAIVSRYESAMGISNSGKP